MGGGKKPTLPQPIIPNLLPVNLLPADGQLAPKVLERPLAQRPESPIQLLLVLLLVDSDSFHDLSRSSRVQRNLNRLRGEQPNIPIFVVVNIHLNGTGKLIA